MIVSTKGRYALRVMVHFAQRGNEGFIPLKEIAEAEGISHHRVLRMALREVNTGLPDDRIFLH